MIINIYYSADDDNYYYHLKSRKFSDEIFEENISDADEAFRRVQWLNEHRIVFTSTPRNNYSNRFYGGCRKIRVYSEI